MLELLAPCPGERILDVGCGTGQLTAEIARAGAETLGIDSSPAMIEQATKNYPGLKFEVADVRALPFREEFDAVFSNAALHWVQDAEPAAAAMAAALKAGGRFVAEFGGRGNIADLVDAALRALESLGIAGVNPWYFPSVGEYAGLLERHGLEVAYAALIDRRTPLEGGPRGMADWIDMFGGPFTAKLAAAQKQEFGRRVEQLAAPKLFQNGGWSADYRRLRIAAVKV